MVYQLTQKSLRPNRLLLFFALAMLGSCKPKDDCADFPLNLSSATKSGVILKETSRNQALDKAITAIDRCYDRAIYARKDFEKSLERMSVGGDGKYYVFFSFIGIEDDWLVFRIDQNGRIDAVFTYSPLSVFAVPA